MRVACADESAAAACAPPVVTFALVGGGARAEIAAVGSGDPRDAGSFGGPTRRTYRGRATAIVRPGAAGADAEPGVVTLSATADGLEGARVAIRVLAAPAAGCA